MWILLPLAGALIGWITNLLAVRMIFRPRDPVRIPLLGMRVQGLLPKRQADLARSVGEVVERDLLPVDELLALLELDRYREQVLEHVVGQVDERLANGWSRYLPESIRRGLVTYARSTAARETALVLDEVGVRLTEDLRSRVKLAPLVESQMARLRTDELERLLWQVAGHEFRWIEYLGAILGFAIGLGQAAVLAALR
ncbi:DUF445 domain-containing protein [Limnochorda pilosa]|nr:DUF445 family protein [Limnochorda pilosa]